RFISTFIWELPVGTGRQHLASISKAANTVIGGWQVSGITTLQTGPYLTPFFSGADPSGTGANVRGVQGTQRPDRIGDGNLGNPRVAQYFERDAFVAPPNTIRRFSRCGVVILT